TRFSRDWSSDVCSSDLLVPRALYAGVSRHGENMDWLSFFERIIGHVAWPLAAVILVSLLRKEIKALLPFVKRLKAGPVEAEFEREVKELRATTEVQPQLVAPAEGLSPEKQMLLQLVQVNPRSAILEAWRGVEAAALRVVSSRGIFVPPREASSPLAVIRALTKDSVLSPDEVSLFHELRSLRNQASYADDFRPTLDAALNYVELAGRLRATLERAAQ